MTDTTKRVVLFVGDVVAISLFVPLGAFNHKESLTPAVIGRNLIPLVICWCAVAAVIRTYRRPKFRWVILNWAIAVPLAVAIRGLWLGGWARLTSKATLIFGPMAMLVTLTLVCLWRLAFLGIEKMKGHEAADAASET